MNERNMEKMKAWLAAQRKACLQRQQELQREERRDEAVFQRIRANVFELSAAVLNAAAKQRDPDGFFRLRMQQISSSWASALQTAEAHCDAVQAHLERLKLEAAEEILSAFERIWSEEA